MRETISTRMIAAAMLTAGLLMMAPLSAHAKPSAEQQCQKGRYEAAAKYAQCQNKALAQLFFTNDLVKLQPALSKCRVTYTGTWIKLQKKALGTGSTCDSPRFVVDTTYDDAHTVIDNLTGLEWELKTALGRSNKDDLYFWATGNSSKQSGGFLGKLNNDGGSLQFCSRFTCDWRLPTVAELQTILSQAFPCTTSPCIDPVFGPTIVNDDYWSSTTLADNKTYAWGVFFATGEVSYGLKTSTNVVRAVRGGL